MTEWSFWDYVDERGVNVIDHWLMDKREVPVKTRAKITRLLLQRKRSVQTAEGR
jgi:hypothetical protein